MEKSQIIIEDIQEINLNTLLQGDFSTKDTNEIDEIFTASEMSALISSANKDFGPIKDVRVSFKDNGKGEISFFLSESIFDFLEAEGIISSLIIPQVYAIENNASENNSSFGASLTDAIITYVANLVDSKPIYTTGELYRDSENSVQIKIESLHVGRVPLPSDTVKKVEYETVRVVNTIISRENGFHIEELQIRDGEMYYRGTLPKEIKGVRL